MQLTIRMPDEHMGKIKLIAKKLGLKKSDVTRMAIYKFLEEFNDSTIKPYDKVKHLVGVAESGISDLGQRHRDHLEKKIKGENK